VYKWLDANCRYTKKGYAEKGCRGTYLRVFHWAEYKEIRPLSSLAEVKTLEDTNGKPVTRLSHLWYEYKNPGWIKCREYACLTCSACSKLNFPACDLGSERVGIVKTCQIKLASGATVSERETGNRGRARAMECVVGDLIGAECANKTEPYVVCQVAKAFSKWKGENGRSWMGVVKEGDEYLTCRKYQKRTDTSYLECPDDTALFYLLAEDVRVLFRKHKEVHQVQRSRRGSTVPTKTPVRFELDVSELELLKNRVYMHNSMN